MVSQLKLQDLNSDRKIHVLEISYRYLMKRVPMKTTSELTLQSIVGFYVRKVTPFGTSAKVDCPKEHLGRTVYLVVVNE